MMRDKLGLFGTDEKDKLLILDLLTWMHQNKVDYTNTFCHLMNLTIENNDNYKNNDFLNWKKRWQERLKTNNNSPKKYINLMRGVNPLVIPRNHIVEEALAKANDGNLKLINQLLNIVSKPYIEQENLINFQFASKSNKDYQTFCGT